METVPPFFYPDLRWYRVLCETGSSNYQQQNQCQTLCLHIGNRLANWKDNEKLLLRIELKDKIYHDRFRYFLRIEGQCRVIITSGGSRDGRVFHISIKFSVLGTHRKEGSLHANRHRRLVADESLICP